VNALFLFCFCADLREAAGGQASASYSVFPDDYRVPFQKRKLVGIPEGLFQYYNSKYVA
jgi:nuclear pore complex protein Nup155